MDLAVVIVTWNVRDLVLQALESLLSDLADSGLLSTVYVVDNASTDGTAQAVPEQFPQVRLIASAENLGFGKGNNLAIRQAMAEGASVIYLLNSDTITQRGATRTLYDVLQADPQVGLVGARLTYGDGGFQHSAFMFPGLRYGQNFSPRPDAGSKGRSTGAIHAASMSRLSHSGSILRLAQL
jgi:N-acetylglucosaminyl-diphospho-decaprenol L-rhamnosyltransferase